MIQLISSEPQDLAMLYKLFPESDKKYLANIYHDHNCNVMDTIKQVSFFNRTMYVGLKNVYFFVIFSKVLLEQKKF